MESSLEYGLEWDRDQLVQLASRIRSIFWPVSLFIGHPMVLFVLIRKTYMDRDCKLAFVCHDVIMIFFDLYNGLFYQLYTLLPYPVFCCTGILCDQSHSPRTLFTILAFWTIAQCIPYLFVMMRLHQKMLYDESTFKLSNRAQAILMIGFSAVLVSNVYGFGAWSGESAERDEILQIPSISWVQNHSRKLLVLGRKYGDIGEFNKEMYLLVFSILVCFSFYLGITYHAVFVIGKDTFRTLQRSKTYQVQLRFMISMSIQAAFTSLFFILPLLVLFLSLATPIASLAPVSSLPYIRCVLVVVFSCCSIGHSTVFLCKSAWVIKKVRAFVGKQAVETGTITVAVSTTIPRKIS